MCIRDREKIVALAITKSDTQGVDFGLVRVYSADASEDTEIKMFEVDSKMYSKGTYLATSKFIQNHTLGFFDNLK